MDIVIIAVSVAMALYHLVSTQYLLQDPIMHQNTHLAFALVLVFLVALTGKRRRPWPLTLFLILLAIVSTGYIRFFYGALQLRLGVPTIPDMIIGIILVILVIEAIRQAFGWILPAICLISIAYTVFGQYAPEPFWHFPIGLDSMISNYNMGFTGMYGMFLGVSTNYIFLFILFGGLFRASGATRLFVEICKPLAGMLKGGSGMMAVVSSALFGMVTGIGGVDVAVTGSFTIPMMKAVGYRPEQAAAIEATAATGAALVPPVMGVAAFVMADLIGKSYASVCLMAIIPSVLYYFSVGLFVQFNAVKLNISASRETVDFKTVIICAPLFVIPVATLTTLLFRGYSPMYAAFWAIVTLVLLALIRRQTRGSVSGWLKGCVEGARAGAEIGVSCALMGVVVTSITITGLGYKLPSILEAFSAGNVLIALGIVGILTIIAGCFVPPLSTYILISVLCVPALTRLGIALASAHFFVFFFSVFALITPPVGFAVLVAAPLAGADYFKTAAESVKAGLVGFLLPFFGIYCPIVLLQPQDWVSAVISLPASFASVFCLQGAFVGYVWTGLVLWTRAFMGLSGVFLLAFVITQNYLLLVIGLILGIIVVSRLLIQRMLPSSIPESRNL